MSGSYTYEMRDAALRLHLMGANVVAIPEGEKGPTYKWKHWHTQQQRKNDVQGLMWNGWKDIPAANGVGVVNGINGWRSFDLDQCPTFVPVATLLQALELPADYAWVEQSGSENGWHVWIICHDDMPRGVLPCKNDKSGVFTGVSKDGSFHHLELRWQHCQTIIAPSLHQSSGKRYCWTGAPPAAPPSEVGIAAVLAGFNAIARGVTSTLLAAPVASSRSTDQAKDEIRRRFDMVAYALTMFGGDMRHEGNEVRILGHGGLLIKPDEEVWYNFTDEVGGDCFDLVGKALFDGRWDRKNKAMFVDALAEAARITGVNLPSSTNGARGTKHMNAELQSRGQHTLIEAPMTDAGNAECLALLYGNKFRYCHTRAKWLRWDSVRWQIDVDGAIQRAALDVARERQVAAIPIDDVDRKRDAISWGIRSESLAKRVAMVQTAAVLHPFATTVDLYDRDPLLATVKNGTLDLSTGTLRPSEPDDYLTLQLGTAFDSDASCPRWLRFLHEVFAGDTELIAYIQRAVGYSLTGDTSEQKLFLCHGSGANGKSVLLETISLLTGDYAANASFDTFDAGRRSEATNDLAALKGKRLVTVIETDEDRYLAEARVKAVTGQDAISCRFLYGEYFTYRPSFKIWLAMNHKPGIRGTDNGIWRRVQLIPFTQNFSGRADTYLGEKLRAELPGILNWALAGLADWQANGLGTAAAVEAATAEYRREADLVSQWLEDETISDSAGVLRTGEAITSYREWCKERGYREPNERGLGRRMVELRYARAQTGSRRERSYLGLRLKRPGEH